ncbi:hypothetical protein ACFSC6_04550 [Rufibacter sediminis]|uniref:Lipoprotein n=1 Tax=Rufibacter sediminis TaxID=2762756 RepID=A0ABR6VT35_9BACT|nr:hypothetical protein [Rufibacter sediminis]MBC3540008.1 hypothetical protein [Rufibacter sediminis]
MGKVTNGFFLLLALSLLGACERVKDKEAVADLPKTSVEDTLVFTPDTLEMDTVLTETDLDAHTGTDTYAQSDTDGLATAEDQDRSDAATSTGTRTASAETNEGTRTAVASGGSAATAKAAPARKRYVRPTRQQLQTALARDARRSNQMDLPQLKNYWLRRQHYYRRATKDIKYVAGDTKIKISTEETKIETPRGKVKIEGNDIKIKYD